MGRLKPASTTAIAVLVIAVVATQAQQRRVPGTGVAVVTKPGDVFFHPSNFYHGFSEVTPDIFWLNIRWDDNYKVN